MNKTWTYILLGAGLIAAIFFLKRKSKAATSAAARATTAGTTTGKAKQDSTASAASAGQGWSGWLTKGQNVLNNTSSNVRQFQEATQGFKNLSGTFAGLFSGGGGSPSPNTSGSGAGVPVDYEQPGPNTSQNSDNYTVVYTDTGLSSEDFGGAIG